MVVLLLSRFTFLFQSLLSIANGNFMSTLIYGIACWGGTTLSNIRELQKIWDKWADRMTDTGKYGEALPLKIN